VVGYRNVGHEASIACKFRGARCRVTEERWVYFAAQLAAQIFDIEVARKFVRQAIEEALAVNRRIPEGLSEADLDRIFTYQPVHFEDMGYFVTGSSVRTSRGCGTRYVASVTGASTSGRSSRRHQGQNPVRTKPSSERIPGQLIAAAEQTTARGHLDRACGNSVPPKTRPAGFQGLTLSPSDRCRPHPHP